VRDRRAEEYRAKAQHARDKAKIMLNETARETMIEAAQMWDAMARAEERKKGPK